MPFWVRFAFSKFVDSNLLFRLQLAAVLEKTELHHAVQCDRKFNLSMYFISFYVVSGKNLKPLLKVEVYIEGFFDRQ